MVPSTGLKNNTGTANIVTNWSQIPELDGDNVRGLAFLGDKLYVGATGSAELYEVTNWKTLSWGTSPTLSGNLYSAGGANAIATPSDFASCSYPTRTSTPSGPAYKVQKSIVDEDGAVTPAGTTGGMRTLNPDGSVTIDYLVTVTAVGTAAGTFPTITDAVTVPQGFQITGVYLDGVQQAGTSFSIPGTSLDPTGASTTSPISRTYKVTVTARAADLNTVDWTAAGTCNTDGAGTPAAGGFVNLVAMTGDSDGSSNNDACAPISSGQLSLVKKIVNPDGTETASTDSRYFTLVAAGPTLVQGSSPNSGDEAAGSRVIPGTYRLHEQGNDGGATSGLYRQSGTWACTEGPLAVAKPLNADGTLTIADGEDVTCTVQNTRDPKVHIVKTASDPTDNPHIGKTITPGADDKFTVSYGR